MNKQELEELIESIKTTHDIHGIEALYNQVLSEPGLQFKLSMECINEIRWARAINLLTLTNNFLLDEEPSQDALSQSLRFVSMAIDEIKKYKNNCGCSGDIENAKSFLIELEATKEMVIEDLEVHLESNSSPGLN